MLSFMIGAIHHSPLEIQYFSRKRGGGAGAGAEVEVEVEVEAPPYHD